MQLKQLSRHILTYCLCSIFSLYATASVAGQEKRQLKKLHAKPVDCFEHREVHIHAGEKSKPQRLILIHNKSKNLLWVTHPQRHVSASAGWSTSLYGGHWSALAVGEKKFSIACIDAMPGVNQTVDCKSVLEVYQVTSAVFDYTCDGTYWVAENQPLEQLLKSVKARRIKFTT